MEDPPVEHPPTVTLTFQVKMSVAHEKSQALREGGCGGLFQQTHSLNDDAVFLFYLARSAEILWTPKLTQKWVPGTYSPSVLPLGRWVEAGMGWVNG